MTNESHPRASPGGVDVRLLVVRAVALPLLLMTILAGALAWQVERLSSAASAVERAERVIAKANEAQRCILDQETGLRAFLVTRDRSFLQPYQDAHPEEALDALDRLYVEGPAPAATLSVLRARYREWHLHAAEALVDPAEAAGRAAMTARKTEMDVVRALLDGIVAHEEGVRGARARAVEEGTHLTMLGSMIVLAGLGGTLSILTRRTLRRVADAYGDALARSVASEAALSDVVEREREARERALGALRAKDEFLSTLSHELRTPLTAILGWSGVLLARDVPPDTARRALAAIERNARSQSQIVDDLLDVSRIVAGKFRLHLATTDVTAVVRAALDVVRFSAESKGVVIEALPSAGPIRLIGDADRLQQVVWNLLSNAVKFTPKKGRVEVRVSKVESRVSIEVRDTGEGITQDFLPHVFERFRQADSSLKRAHGGLGLGLSLVKHLVDLHGGEVRAESEGAGCGAVFTVTLPVAAAGPLSAPAVVGVVVSGPVSLSGIRVLVVDDDPDSLAVLAAILRERGADVRSASSGAAALELLDRGSFDVIVSDIGMPELDGYELIQKVRAAAAAAPPAVALTAYAGAEDVARALSAGFQRHLAKPVTPDHLVAAVAGLVRTG